MQVATPKRPSLRDNDVEAILDPLSSKQCEVLALHYGLHDGRRHTLESIGARLHVTKERVRQIECQAVNKLRNQKMTLDRASQYTKEALEASGGLVPFERLVREFRRAMPEVATVAEGVVSLALRLDPNVAEERIGGIRMGLLRGSPVAMIGQIQRLCKSILRAERIGLSLDEVTARVLGQLPESGIDKTFVTGAIRACPGLIVWEGTWLFHGSRISGPRLLQISRILREAGQALHYSVIAERLNQRMDKKSSLRAVLGFLERNSEFFERTGRGKFELRQRETGR